MSLFIENGCQLPIIVARSVHIHYHTTFKLYLYNKLIYTLPWMPCTCLHTEALSWSQILGLHLAPSTNPGNAYRSDKKKRPKCFLSPLLVCRGRNQTLIVSRYSYFSEKVLCGFINKSIIDLFFFQVKGI